jgi:prolipoprotein diacylglyceryltransferase
MPPHLAYTLCMLLAIVGLLVARRVQPDPQLAPLPRTHRLILAWAAFVGAGIGAKLPFVLVEPPHDWLDPRLWLGDGKTILTGMAGGYLAVELAKVALGITAKTGDGIAFPLAVAVAVGRWGCFFNGCCFGTETHLPWACNFGDGAPRHPTQAYESLFHIAMAAVLWQLASRGLLRRQRLKLYLIAYCVFRFATEFIRPEPRVFAGLTTYQWGAVTIAAALAIQWQFDRATRAGAPGGSDFVAATPMDSAELPA